MVDLFDFGGDGGRAPSEGDPEDDGREVYSVARLTRKIRNLLEMRVGEVWVEGEISNLRRQASGHQYFTLKDDKAQISCVLFRNNARGLAAPLDDGQKVQLFGEVSVYEPRGNYQIIVRLVQDKGVGALQAKFEALKRKLADEGLFDEAAKLPVPRFPRCVCLVTSPTGAALQDMLNILERRAPWLRILLYPVRVQGAGAAGEIVAALEHLRSGSGLPAIDTVILGRGGGSLEDLWPFNEEPVARAIRALGLPIISAVGHEIDFTISDFAADMRAPTPSAAAELVAPDVGELHARLDGMGSALENRAGGALERWSERLDYLGRSALVHQPARLLPDLEQDVDWKSESLASAARGALGDGGELLSELRHRLALCHPTRKLERTSSEFDALARRLGVAAENALAHLSERCSTAGAALKNLGPDSVLSRGYSVTLDADGNILTDPANVEPGDKLVTKLAGGELHSTAD